MHSDDSKTVCLVSSGRPLIVCRRVYDLLRVGTDQSHRLKLFGTVHIRHPYLCNECSAVGARGFYSPGIVPHVLGMIYRPHHQRHAYGTALLPLLNLHFVEWLVGIVLANLFRFLIGSIP